MARKLVLGLEGVGHVEGLDEEMSAAFLRLDERGGEVSLPRVGSTGDLFVGFLGRDADGIPTTLRYHDTKGSYVLGGCRDVGGSVSTLGTGLTRLRAQRVIDAGDSDVDYVEVDGMASEIDGLSNWSGMSTVTQTTDFRSWVSLRAENQEPILLGGDAEATVESSFTYNPSPNGNVFGITDLSIIRTRTDDLRPWQEHAAVHHMVQDLMCLVFGKPCLARIATVKREDDQPYAAEDDDRRLWREVYEPTFGRAATWVEPLDRAKEIPLFRLGDVDRSDLDRWIENWDLWSRPTWIAVTTMFQRGTTIESRLLQVGVALEALGHALWTATGGTGRTPQYPELLELVTNAVAVEHPRIYAGQPVDAWRNGFNAAFKGTKHADNPLPSGVVARDFAAQGMNLIRAWLGTQLGVADAILESGFDRRG